MEEFQIFRFEFYELKGIGENLTYLLLSGSMQVIMKHTLSVFSSQSLTNYKYYQIVCIYLFTVLFRIMTAFLTLQLDQI